MTTKETLGVFGASGQTGKHVVKCALELGWKVQALVRNPKKLDIQHDNLSVIQGDFESGDVIKETLQGVTLVISWCADGPHNAKRWYNKGFMEKIIREQLWPALQVSKPRAFLLSSWRIVPNLLISYLWAACMCVHDGYWADGERQ
jgi:putative NADH-flavin reductase